MMLEVRPLERLVGEARVPGDKSISHRAALLAAVARGSTEIDGFLEAEDCLATIAAVRALGADVLRTGAGTYRVTGAGRRGLREPANVIDCGNSGTTARLLLGLLAGQPFWSMLTGDDSLRRRPMGRVAAPLRTMGATVVGRADSTQLPLAVRGAERVQAITYESPVASAQVKSAILLAGLTADAPVRVTEPAPSRDHSERMLRDFGARVDTVGTTVTLTPGELTAARVRVPGDISSAAFLLVAGLVVPDTMVTVRGVGVNPTRTGLLDVIEAMGGKIEWSEMTEGAEPTATLTVRASGLTGVTIEGPTIPRLIDEIPVLAVLAATAQGVTEVRGAAELRVKESDRIAAIARELGKMGVNVEERPDGFRLEGPQHFRGARVQSGGDHRMAMALAVAGLVADGPTIVEDTACIATSFPAFASTLNALAGREALSLREARSEASHG
jgi:3-phosphoshikimate 1-carboxyvinyltransferase